MMAVYCKTQDGARISWQSRNKDQGGSETALQKRAVTLLPSAPSPQGSALSLSLLLLTLLATPPTKDWISLLHLFSFSQVPLNYCLGLPWWLRWWRICLQCRRPRFDPWVRKISWRRKWQPTPAFLPGKYPWAEGLARPQAMGSQRVGHNLATNHLHTHTHIHTHKILYCFISPTFYPHNCK